MTRGGSAATPPEGAHERDRERPVENLSRRSRPPYSSSVTRGSRFQEGVVLVGVQVPTPTT
jgi:hypothetical protein